MNIPNHINTVESLVTEILNEYTYEEVRVGFDLRSVQKLNDTYSVSFVVILKDILPSEFGDIDVERMSLTDAGDIDVTPSFRTTTEHPDQVLVDSSVYDVTTAGRDREADLSSVKQACEEVILSQEDFIEFVEEGSKTDTIIDMVEVSCFDSEETQTARALADELLGSDTSTDAPEDGFYFRLHIRGGPNRLIDGVLATHRFDHVSSVVLDGEKYPATIDLVSIAAADGGNGQLIHSSDFVAEEDPHTPKINISDEIERINWDNLLASPSPWPESPPFAPQYR
jgi:hypothetical protein